jgi:hypothetical protein
VDTENLTLVVRRAFLAAKVNIHKSAMQTITPFSITKNNFENVKRLDFDNAVNALITCSEIEESFQSRQRLPDELQPLAENQLQFC